MIHFPSDDSSGAMSERSFNRAAEESCGGGRKLSVPEDASLSLLAAF